MHSKGLSIDERESREREERGRGGNNKPWTFVSHKKTFHKNRQWDNARDDRRNNLNKEIKTFFYVFFSEGYQARDFYGIFLWFGAVDEVVILAKRDMRRKSYGFFSFMMLKMRGD